MNQRKSCLREAWHGGVVLGSLIGMSLPFVLSRVGLDPATASGPLVTSIADITGVLVYFGFASAWLGAGSGGA